MSQLLSNDIVTLRALEPTDLDILYRWENDTLKVFLTQTGMCFIATGAMVGG